MYFVKNKSYINSGNVPVTVTNLDIDGATEISDNDPLEGNDLFIIDHGANGTNRSSKISKIYDYINNTGLTKLGEISEITITNAPTNSNHATNKSYVDSVASGSDVKKSVRVATTTNGTFNSSFSNGQTIDGIPLVTGDRILIKNQEDSKQNGIYTVNETGSPTRATDFDSNNKVSPGCFTFVEQGTTNADTGWVLSTDGSINLGNTDLTFTQFSGAGLITAGSGLTKEGNTLNVNIDDLSIGINNQNKLEIKSTWSEGFATAAQGTTADNALPASSVSDFGASLIDDLNAEAARTTLGLGSAATSASTAFATAAQGTTADNALPASNVSDFGASLIDDTDAATARATLGLGSAATSASTAFATAAQGTTADNALPASNVSDFGASLIDDLNAEAARTTLGLGSAATSASTAFATAAQGTTADNALPASSVSDFGGTLIDDLNAEAARATLELGSAATSDSTAFATAAQGTTADNALPASNVSDFGATLIDDTDAATARATLGLGTTHNVEFSNITLKSTDNRTIKVGANNTPRNLYVQAGDANQDGSPSADGGILYIRGGKGNTSDNNGGDIKIMVSRPDDKGNHQYNSVIDISEKDKSTMLYSTLKWSQYSNATERKIELVDNKAIGLDMGTSESSFLKFVTTTDSQKIVISKNLEVSSITGGTWEGNNIGVDYIDIANATAFTETLADNDKIILNLVSNGANKSCTLSKNKKLYQFWKC